MTRPVPSLQINVEYGHICAVVKVRIPPMVLFATGAVFGKQSLLPRPTMSGLSDSVIRHQRLIVTDAASCTFLHEGREADLRCGLRRGLLCGQSAMSQRSIFIYRLRNPVKTMLLAVRCAATMTS
jgi:hypothetical protein